MACFFIEKERLQGEPWSSGSKFTGQGLQDEGGGGASEVVPLQKKRGGGADKVSAMLMGELEVLAILIGRGGGCAKKFLPFKRRVRKVLPCLEGGGAPKVLDLQFFHFVVPPPRN